MVISAFGISSFITALLSLTQALFIFVKNRDLLINRSWIKANIAVSVWSFGLFFVVSSNSRQVAELAQNILDISAIAIPVFFLEFVVRLSNKEKKNRLLVRFAYVITILLSVFSFSPLFKQGVEPLGSFQFWINPGSLYILFPIYFVVLNSVSLLFLLIHYKKSSGVTRQQIKYVMIASAIGFVGGSTNFLPQISHLYPFGNFLVTLYIVIITYAITKYRLMDIRLVIRKAVFYIGMGIFVVSAYYLVAWSDYTSFGGPFTLGALLTAIVFAPLFLAGFVFMSKKLKQLSNKYFFASLYDYQETLDKFSKDVSSTINLPEVANVVVDTVQQTMRMDNVGLFVKNKHYEPMKIIGFNESNLTRMVTNSRCSDFISAIKKPLVYDELVRNAQNYNYSEEDIEYAKEQMKSQDVAVVLPLVSKGELISCIILGKKISRDAYTQEDMRLLESLANHAAISIENARLYNEIQGFNETLKYKVDDATKRLRELLKIKSDFLTVASHQLRTPTSIVRGMLSLVIEEKDLPNDERERFISQAYEGINRLERIIHELLNATELEGKKMRMDFKKVRIEHIIEEIVRGLLPLADQLKVKLVFDKPVRPIPKTLADPIKLKEAITNIIDNAVHYTAGGNVNISARRKENQIVIEVTDNGIGMSKNDLRSIFTKFTRGEGILQVHPNGTGLGLFIAKKMLEAMGGTITAESKGKNKGSKFTLTIPIK
ncbi:MAG: ATP-binding protein [Patescibacteria group bacterium]